MAPIAIGAVLMVMIYAGGHISGAHYNPAVTIAAWLRGKCPASDIVPYIEAQLAASVAASFAVKALKTGVVTKAASLGGAMTPAVALGLCLMGIIAWNSLWIYVVACFAGSIVAATAFKAVNGND